MDGQDYYCIICKSQASIEINGTDKSIAICLFCESLFHYSHAKIWLEQNSNCPNCRQTILKLEQPSILSKSIGDFKPCDFQHHLKLRKEKKSKCDLCKRIFHYPKIDFGTSLGPVRPRYAKNIQKAIPLDQISMISDSTSNQRNSILNDFPRPNNMRSENHQNSRNSNEKVINEDQTMLFINLITISILYIVLVITFQVSIEASFGWFIVPFIVANYKTYQKIDNIKTGANKATNLYLYFFQMILFTLFTIVLLLILLIMFILWYYDPILFN